MVPHTSLEIYTNTERSQTDFERFHIACMMISIRLFDFNRTLDLAKHIKLNLPSTINEFTSKRDLAYYITISLISLRDYRAISEKFQDPVLYNFLKNDACAKDCISSLVRNNFKLAVQNLRRIFHHLSMDPLIGAKSNHLKNICLSSIIVMYLEAFTVIKIDSLASDLEISPKDVSLLLEQEIKAKKINFLINKVGDYVERSDKQQTHIELLAQATQIMTKHNESQMKKMIAAQYGHKDTGRGFGGGGMNMEEDTGIVWGSGWMKL